MNIKKLSQLTNNFYKLCEYSFEKEYNRRESREIPSKSQADISDLEQYVDKDYAIHFADLSKIGINPRSTYKTPIAVCGYPLTRRIYDQLVNNKLPFAQEKKYMHLFKIKDGLNVNNYDENRYEQDLKKILELVKNNNEWKERIGFDKSKSDEYNINILKNFGRTYKKPYPFSEMWNIGRLLCNNKSKWNHLLRYLGINAAIDYGNGILHENEPEQVMIFNINNLELVKTHIGSYYLLKKYPIILKEKKEEFNKLKSLVDKYKKYYKITNVKDNFITLTDKKNRIIKIEKDDEGNERWYLNGKLHREDGPAMQWANGYKQWYINDELHREDGPAVENADGTKIWYLNGKLHREDGPAFEEIDGTKKWYKNGQLHREDGPAVEEKDGHKEWWLNGKLHREVGPAIENRSGTKKWYLNDKHHREDGPAIEYANGDKYWLLNGKHHREDGPAIEKADGTKEWYLNDELHREDGPAVENADGTKEWYLNGKLHREDGPAIEKADGTKIWYLNGKFHREDGPAIEWENGDKEWHLNGKLHREDGPAAEHSNGAKEWWLNGKLHREDGPAIEYANGDKYWYLNDRQYTEEGFNKIMNKQ